MLDIGWMEMAVIAIIALLIVGPKDLPRVIRSTSEWAGKARSMAREFRSSLDDIAREGDLASLKSDIEAVALDTSSDMGGSILNDEAASTHDFSDDDSNDGDVDYWKSWDQPWRHLAHAEGAKNWPTRHKAGKARRAKSGARRSEPGARRKVRS